MEDKKLTLTEAFQSLKSLTEDVFDIDDEGITAANSFMDQDMDEVETVIDPLATSEEELQDSYLGNVILDCVICQSKIYKEPEEVTISEDGSLANVGEICPYCQSSDGFKIIGKVAKYCPHCDHEDEEHIDTEVEDEEKEIEIESEEEIDKSILKEEDKPAAVSIEDAQKWVDYDMEKYGRISGRTNSLVKKAGFQIIKDDHGDYEVAAGKFESINEEVEKVDIETESDRVTMEQDENGKVVVTTEPKEEIEEVEDTETIIAPVDETTESEFKQEGEEETEEEDFEDIDMDEFEEESFNQLGEKYLKRVYENVQNFRTTKGAVNGNTLKLEGLITFKSGKKANTNFVFESKSVTKSGKLKLEGMNKQFAKGDKAFSLVGRMEGKKFLAESLTYNYTAKDGLTGEATKIYGRVSR